MVYGVHMTLLLIVAVIVANGLQSSGTVILAGLVLVTEKDGVHLGSLFPMKVTVPLAVLAGSILMIENDSL